MKRVVGYSGKPLAAKLGLKDGIRFSSIREPKNYPALLGKLPEGVVVLGARSTNLDLLHLFTMNRRELTRDFPNAKGRINSNGSLWVSWPKLSSTLNSDLNENIVREFCLANGLVDVKVAAIDENWSGLKFMYRLKDRPPKDK